MSVFEDLSQAPAYVVRPRIRDTVSRACACPFTPPAYPQRMARLSLPGLLITYRNGLPARRRSLVPVQPGPTYAQAN